MTDYVNPINRTSFYRISNQIIHIILDADLTKDDITDIQSELKLFLSNYSDYCHDKGKSDEYNYNDRY